MGRIKPPECSPFPLIDSFIQIRCGPNQAAGVVPVTPGTVTGYLLHKKWGA